MSLKPYNDNIKVEVESDEYGFAGKNQQQGVETGIVVEVPEFLPYLGFHSFAFENSLQNLELKDLKTNLSGLLALYKKLVGKRVYWTQYQERGSILKQGNKTYAFLKLTDIIAFDTDSKARPAKSIATKESTGIGLN